jgi:hypothetical protein
VGASLSRFADFARWPNLSAVLGTTAMATGWMIGVMVELAGEPAPLRHFFAVGHEDRAKAEWKAIDGALLIGRVATSPVKGLEPVHVVSELSANAVRSLGLKAGEVRALGWRWPRKWISIEQDS